MPGKKRNRQKRDKNARRVDPSKRQRRVSHDVELPTWERQASQLEQDAQAHRAARIEETRARNSFMQKTICAKPGKKKQAGPARAHTFKARLERDRTRFYDSIDSPQSVICGSCGALSPASSAQIRDMDFSEDYFSPLLGATADGAPRGIYEVAVVQDASTSGGNGRVCMCDRCHASLKKKEVPRFSLASGFSVGVVPEELAILNDTETRMIGLGLCFTSCYQIRGAGQECTKGHTISYWNEACSIVSRLPRPLSKCGVIRLRTASQGASSSVLTVRPNLIRIALLWLRSNNPLYAKVEVAEDLLADLATGLTAEDEPSLVIESLGGSGRENANDEACDKENECAEDVFILNTQNLAEQTESEQILTEIEKSRDVDTDVPMPQDAINEYSTKAHMQLCFPTLFPHGVGGLNPIDAERRLHSFELADYCSHLMRWHDRRFVIHKSFKFFCLNLIQRRQIDGLTKRMTQRSPNENEERAEIGEAQEEASYSEKAHARAVLKELKPFFRSVRGSGLYWSNVRSDLMGMIGNRVMDQAFPTFFFTLSAADTIWPDVFCACDPSLSLEAARELPATTRRRLLNENPDIACRHFYRRFKSFFDNILMGESKPLGKIVDFFWRVEFQRRGSPHIHGLLWIENAPDVLELSETEEGRLKLAEFVDKHIAARTFREGRDNCECIVCRRTKTHPNIDVLVDRPPSLEDERATMCDLASLISRVQQHKCFDGSACRAKTGRCRFDYPKQLCDETVIHTEIGADGAVKIEVQCQRDDAYTNGYSPCLLQAWRANMDLKLVGNAYGAAEYVAAYVSKSEPDTVKFHSAITEALHKSANLSHLSELRKVANASIATREVSAQEALWILQRALPMYGKSRTIMGVKVLRHEKRFYRVHANDCLREMETPGTVDTTSATPRMEEMERAYSSRPRLPDFDQMSYRYFVEHFDISKESPTAQQRLKRWVLIDGKGYIKERRIPQAVIKSPKLRIDSSNADYCFSEIFMSVPWRHLSELPTSDEDCVDYFSAMERSEELQRAIERQEQMDLHSRDATPLGPLNESPWTFTNTVQLTNGSTSPPEDAQVPPQNCCTEAEYQRAKVFINMVVKPYVDQDKKRSNVASGEPSRTPYQYPIGNAPTNMTDEQWVPFSLWMKQSRKRRAASTTHRSCTPMTMILNGEGGAGKSWLLRHIVKDIHSVWNELGTSVRRSKRVLLMAHLGTAAFNIKGSTICTALGFGASGLGTNKPYQSIEGTDTLRRLQDKYAEVQLVVIDEYSVISCGMLYSIDRRMREIWPSCKHLPFGGRDVIMSGDMGQLAPVLPATLATPSEQLHRANQTKGRELWETFDHVCTLKSQKRGAEDPEWYEALARLRRMEQSTADLQLFNSRYFAAEDTPAWAKQATHIAYRNADVDAANDRCLEDGQLQASLIKAAFAITPNLKGGDVCQPIAAHAIETAEADAILPNAQRDRIVRPFVRLAIGVPVTLTHNLCQQAGLCNGTKAVVYAFMLNPGGGIPIVLIQVKDKYIGPSFCDHVADVVPIPPQSVSWLSPNKTLRTTRTGIPLRVAYAMTIHKVQGLTCPKLVFDPIAVPTTSFTYVGLSRVRHRNDIVLTRALEKLKNRQQEEERMIRQTEWDRLDRAEQETRSKAQNGVAEMQTIALLENQRWQSR